MNHKFVAKRASFALVIIGLVLAAASFLDLSVPQDQSNCIVVEPDLELCALSEMAKLADGQAPSLEHDDFAIAHHALKLQAARNETVSMQWILQGEHREGLSFSIDDFSFEGEITSVQPVVSEHIAHYHKVDRGGYTWGPDSNVLAWPAKYPDALVPKTHPCNGDELYDSLPKSSVDNQHTLVWHDVYVPKNMSPGTYQSRLIVNSEGKEVASVPIKIQLWSASLPDENSIDAVGEVYRSYRLEGAGEIPLTAEWSDMSNCYQQVAHAHRSTFLERSTFFPSTSEQWELYKKHYGPMLDGSLFSPERGYIGPGQGTAVSVWRTPWPQPYDMKLERPLNYQELRLYEFLSDDWSRIVEQERWHHSRWFAYVFDEVDGPEHKDEQYLAMTHRQMGRVQQAIDAGSGAQKIDLMWTSHSNPAKWRNNPDLDLRNQLRFWAPNAHAADPEFMAEQAARGDRNWFYHSGHPAVGAHSINASGIELRTWGVIAARYQVHGILMWAVNLGNDDAPFADPNYKTEEDRFGNGVLVYPGNQLPRIGFPASPGAIPSIRLKSWRRGIQDFELARLAAQRHPEQTAKLLQQIVPRALTEGEGEAAWSPHAGDWIEFKKSLLALASGA